MNCAGTVKRHRSEHGIWCYLAQRTRDVLLHQRNPSRGAIMPHDDDIQYLSHGTLALASKSLYSWSSPWLSDRLEPSASLSRYTSAWLLNHSVTWGQEASTSRFIQTQRWFRNIIDLNRSREKRTRHMMWWSEMHAFNVGITQHLGGRHRNRRQLQIQWIEYQTLGMFKEQSQRHIYFISTHDAIWSAG